MGTRKDKLRRIMGTRIATPLPNVAGSFNVYDGNTLVARIDVYDKSLASLDTLKAMHKALGLALKEREHGKEQQQEGSKIKASSQGGSSDAVSVWT